MSREEIKQTIDDFLSLVQKGCDTPEEDQPKLKFLLDKLAMAQHFATCRFDEKNYPDAPREADQKLGKLVGDRFPKLGFYHLAAAVSQNVGESNVTMGWALDDITDIAKDLFETKWRWENNSVEDRLWYFKFSFDTHWSQHLRELQLYLLNLERGT